MNFVTEHNIKRFRRLLAAETDPKKRAVLEQLLAEEEAKLADKPRKPAIDRTHR